MHVCVCVRACVRACACARPHLIDSQDDHGAAASGGIDLPYEYP